MKTCERCKQSLPLAEFSKNRAAPDGVQRWCRLCQRSYHAERKARRGSTRPGVTALVAVRPLGGRPTPKQLEVRDRLCYEVLRLEVEEGLRASEVAERLGLPLRTTKSYLARGKQLTFDGEEREYLRHVILGRLDDLYESAKADGDYKEARLALAEIGRFTGMVSTGGNTFSVGVALSSSDMDRKIDEWLARNDVVDGEIIDGS
jgi:hypothetical protein